MQIILSLLITFFGLWVLITLFDNRIDKKIQRILILTLIIVTVSLVGKTFGSLGGLIAGILNLVVLMKILGYDFLTAFLFFIGLEILQYLIIFGLFL